MGILDWGAFEILVLISGFLGVIEQASCILIMNIVVLAYMVAEGFDTAACTLVGQAIGAGDTSLALNYFHTMQIITGIVIGFMAILVYFQKENIVTIFTDLKDVQDMVLSVIWLISFNTFPDGYKAMLRGVIRALAI